jgi:hypothetical protein
LRAADRVAGTVRKMDANDLKGSRTPTARGGALRPKLLLPCCCLDRSEFYGS